MGEDEDENVDAVENEDDNEEDEDHLGVLAAGGTEGSVGAHGDRVEVARVPDVVGLQLAVG